MTRSLEEIQADKKELAEEEKQALKHIRRIVLLQWRNLFSNTNLQKAILEAKQWSN